jgi:hypothetical protein
MQKLRPWLRIREYCGCNGLGPELRFYYTRIFPLCIGNILIWLEWWIVFRAEQVVR